MENLIFVVLMIKDMSLSVSSYLYLIHLYILEYTWKPIFKSTSISPGDRVEIIISLTGFNFGNLAIFVRVLWGRVRLVSDLAGPSDGDGAVKLSAKFRESFHNIQKYFF